MAEDIDSPDRPAGIEYHGIAGASDDCEAAVLRLLTSGGNLARALILTSGRDHAFLLFNEVGDPIAIKSGFASGYGGSGPTALSRVVEFLNGHGVEIDEVEITEDVLERLDDSALTLAMLTRSSTASVFGQAGGAMTTSASTNGKPATIGRYGRRSPRSCPTPCSIRASSSLPWTLRRTLMGVSTAATDGWRTSCASGLGSSNTAPSSFPPPSRARRPRSFGTWQTPPRRRAAALLFAGVYMAYRNPRAHREMTRGHHLAEFLLLNHLFKLEADAIANPAAAPA